LTGIPTFELKTHFEQVPLETVRKIVDEQLRRETAAEQHQESEKKKTQEVLLGLETGQRHGRNS